MVMLMDSKADASQSYDDFGTSVEKMFQSFIKVPLTTVSVSVGDRGRLSVITTIDQSSLREYLIFKRGTVFEVVGLEVPVTSTRGDKVLLDPAGKADRKITAQPLPIPSRVPCQTVVPAPARTPFDTGTDSSFSTNCSSGPGLSSRSRNKNNRN
jgi:hypothetical protein